MIDTAGTVPCDVLVPVVRLPWRGQFVLWHCQLAFHLTTLARCLHVVLIGDLPTSNDNFGTEFTEHGPCRHHTNSTSLVGVGDDVPVDEVALGLVVDDDLVEHAMLLEEQVGIPETNTPCRFSGKHVFAVAAAEDRERPDSVLSITQKVAIIVDLGLSFHIFRQNHLVVRNLHRLSFLVNRGLRHMRGSAIARPSTTTGIRTAASSLRRGTDMVRSGTVILQIPVRWAVLRRTTNAALSRDCRSTQTRW